MTQVLDHGFVNLIDVMGDDQAIVDAARLSYGEGTKPVSDSAKLIRHLMRHGHTSPFEMVEMKFHCKMPIFVARQWVRHRTANINEYSARYSEMRAEFYVPDIDQLGPQSTENKQGRARLSSESQEAMLEGVQKDIVANGYRAHELYKHLINPEGDNISREIARTVLPVNIYTEWVWKCDLHNIFHFLKLRLDPHAQWEIRQYAEAISFFVQAKFPLAYGAFHDYVLKARNLSRMEVDLICRALGGHPIEKPAEMAKREWDEFRSFFRL